MPDPSDAGDPRRCRHRTAPADPLRRQHRLPQPRVLLQPRRMRRPRRGASAARGHAPTCGIRSAGATESPIPTSATQPLPGSTWTIAANARKSAAESRESRAATPTTSADSTTGSAAAIFRAYVRRFPTRARKSTLRSAGAMGSPMIMSVLPMQPVRAWISAARVRLPAPRMRIACRSEHFPDNIAKKRSAIATGWVPANRGPKPATTCGTRSAAVTA
jgi:hypothetical protein